jgi:hypothetical protein
LAALAGWRSSSLSSAGAVAFLPPLAAPRLAFKASIRSMIWAGCSGVSETSIWWPCTFFSMSAWIRFFTSSSYWVGSKVSAAIWSTSWWASFSSASRSAGLSGMAISDHGRTSSAYSNCCMARPSSTGRTSTRYIFPRAAYLARAQRPVSRMTSASRW